MRYTVMTIGAEGLLSASCGGMLESLGFAVREFDGGAEAAECLILRPLHFPRTAKTRLNSGQTLVLCGWVKG